MHTKTKEIQNFRESLYIGTVYGVTAWIVYAMVEYFFTAIFPWIMTPSHAYMPTHPTFTVMLFFIYPLIGLILGGLSGLGLYVAARLNLFSGKINDSILSTLAVFTVVLAFDANLCYTWLLTSYVGILLLPSFGISLVLLLGLWFSARYPLWHRRLRFITNPWTVTIVLFGILPLVIYEFIDSWSISVKAVSAMLYPFAIFLFSFFIYKIKDMRGAGKSAKTMSTSPFRSLAFLVPIYILIFGTGLFLKQTPMHAAKGPVSLLQGSDKPNVILITMDTINANHLSLYGYERDTSPNLKQLSKESVLYSNAISTSNMTPPSHASIFTGLYTRSHGVHQTLKTLTPSANELSNLAKHSEVLPLSDKFNTLTEILSEKGYLTMAVIANGGYLGPHFNINQGFQHYDYRAPAPFLGHFLGNVRPFYLRQTIHTLSARIISTQDFFKTTRDAEGINNEVFTLLNKAKKEDTNFFMFINYMDAHWPFIQNPPFDTLFPGKDDTFNTVKFDKMESEIVELKRTITDKERKHIISQYDGGIAYEDFHIGKLIARLKETGLYENSLIIVTSDHGEAFGERNFMQHGNSVYQNEVHVPLLIKYPGSHQKAVVDKFVSGVDLMPTILDVLGYEIPGDLQGVSLLKPEFLNNRNIIAESFSARRNLWHHKRFYSIKRTIFSAPMKFISSTSGELELYDLSKDPEEKKNIYVAANSISVDLESKMNRWLSTVKEEACSLGDSVSNNNNRPNKGTLARLKALGYVQ